MREYMCIYLADGRVMKIIDPRTHDDHNKPLISIIDGEDIIACSLRLQKKEFTKKESK